MTNRRLSQDSKLPDCLDVDAFSHRQKFSLAIFAVAVGLFFAENFYFGWHAKAMSPAESAADFGVIALFFLAYLWRPVKVTIEHNVTNMHFQVENGTTICETSKPKVS